MDRQLETAGTWIQKHAKVLVVLFVGYLLLGTPVGMSLLGVVNPGFPGAQAACYGVNFKGLGNGWYGANYVHPISAGEVGLASQGSNLISWGAGTGPSTMTLVWDYPYTIVGQMAEKQMATEIQGQIPLAAYNYQNSTPLTLANVSAWDQGEILQYWNAQASTPINQTLANGTIVSSVTYTATSQSLLLIPGNFYLSIYVPPSQYMSGGTDSGWEEGSWSQVDLWYAIYWYQWLNAYAPVLQANQVPPQIPANALNRQAQFNLKGGFPIAGWIQGYEIPYQTSTGTIYDAMSATPASGSSTGNPIPASTLSNIVAHVSMSPSLTGRQLPLYTQASDSYSLPLYTLPSGPIDANASGLLQSPDFQTVLPAEYFKIGVQALGPDPEPSGGFLGIGPTWTVYYPTVDYLLRFIFGVYGVQTFVWTVQTAMGLGYNATGNYIAPPAQWQTRTIIQATTPGPFSGLFDWFTNPFNDLQFYLVLGIIVILVISVLNPGVWSLILHKQKDS